MAAAKGIMASRIPIRIMPPAMPKMPERKEVDRTAAASAAANGRLIMGGLGKVRWRSPCAFDSALRKRVYLAA